MEVVTDFLFLGSKNHCRWWLQPWNQKMIASWQEIYDKPSVLKSRDITLLTKVSIVKAMVFPVVTYGCENWTIKKAEHQRSDAFKLWYWRSLLRVPWAAREFKPINLKGDQPWIFTGRTDTEASASVFWSSDANGQLTGKIPDAGKDWGWEKKASEDEITGQPHRCNGYELGQILGDGEC